MIYFSFGDEARISRVPFSISSAFVETMADFFYLLVSDCCERGLFLESVRYRAKAM
jgi:hypothetical protein